MNRIYRREGSGIEYVPAGNASASSVVPAASASEMTTKDTEYDPHDAPEETSIEYQKS